VAVVHDYRTLSPSLITDPNGNRAGVLFDELGMVVATAVMGKVTESLGDELDPEDLTKATTWLAYDLMRWKDGASCQGRITQSVKVRSRPKDSRSRSVGGTVARNQDGEALRQDLERRFAKLQVAA